MIFTGFTGTLPICGWGAGSGEVGEWGRELAARVVLGQLPQSIRLVPHQSSSPSWVLTELPPGRLKKVVEVRAGSSTSSFYGRERHRVRGGQHKGQATGAGVPSAFPGLEGRPGSLWGMAREVQRDATERLNWREAQIGSLCSKRERKDCALG